MEAGLGSSGAAAAAISTDERAGPRVRTRSEPGARIASNERGVVRNRVQPRLAPVPTGCCQVKATRFALPR